MSDFDTELGRRVLVCDGAMGTMLHAAGNSLDRALPELNLSNAELVTTVHQSYVSAGVDVILTNTFGASRLRLADHGYSGDVREINLAGARIARQVREAADRQVFVGGSISPAVTAGQRQGIGVNERVEAIAEQVDALAEGGVDVLVFETFGYLDELVEAISTAAGRTDLPIIAQATITGDGGTLGGETPHDLATAVSALPVVALGANCTVGPQGMLAVVEELRRFTSLPIIAQPNAGLPRRVHGRRFEYNIDGDYFARYARRYTESGAMLIGGCCGTTPTHLGAAVSGVADLRPRERRETGTRAAPASGQSELADRLVRRDFVTAAAITPPSGGGADEAAEVVAGLHRRGIDLFTVAARPSTRAQLTAISLALHIQQNVEVATIPTVTTWDTTIMTLQANLLGAHALGVRTVICETGNPPLRGDYPNADGIWEVDSVGLIELLAGLNSGRDCNGLSLATKTSFHIGARFNPGADDIDAEIARTRDKLRAGADFLITRPVYELDTFRRMTVDLSEEDVPVLLAISPLGSFAEAEYLAYEVPDVTIPAATLRAMERAGAGAADVGLELATELLGQARGLARGVVLGVPDGEPERVERLLRAV
ncbi:MAG: bifunctional homocysteine S-methyltransferase/methylenetetrahydrofolate reductase [Pseudonocardiaceae bacterium]|nr:bifunctional homocysteine S-methyltransferase/methylenetetrahydrofolate reductase [Pseudonocardiaceae bacterium]